MIYSKTKKDNYFPVTVVNIERPDFIYHAKAFFHAISFQFNDFIFHLNFNEKIKNLPFKLFSVEYLDDSEVSLIFEPLFESDSFSHISLTASDINVDKSSCLDIKQSIYTETYYVPDSTKLFMNKFYENIIVNPSKLNTDFSIDDLQNKNKHFYIDIFEVLLNQCLQLVNVKDLNKKNKNKLDSISLIPDYELSFSSLPFCKPEDAVKVVLTSRDITIKYIHTKETEHYLLNNTDSTTPLFI